MKLPKLHFITQPTANYTSAQLVEEACLGGAKIIQLRLKDLPLPTIIEEAKAVQHICKKYQAIFILNDYVSIAKELSIDGIHLGKSDCSPLEARKLLGNNTIIGGTANDLEDVLRLIEAEVDYIGLGPYRFTQTKKNLSPVLGIEGYSKIFDEIKKLDYVPPIYAIGGIKDTDVKSILNTGVYGIAVSGLIVNAENIQTKIEVLNSLLASN